MTFKIPSVIIDGQRAVLESALTLSLDALGRNAQKHDTMNTHNVVLVAVGLVIGSLVVLLLMNRDECEPDINYVAIFKGAQFKKDPTIDPADKDAFVAALSKATFRHDMQWKLKQSDSPGPIPGLPDTGSCSKSTASTRVGLHVTQRAGFTNAQALNDALSHLK